MLPITIYSYIILLSTILLSIDDHYEPTMASRQKDDASSHTVRHHTNTHTPLHQSGLVT